MKKSLEKELMRLAEKILQMKNRSDIHELKAMTAVLYEKLAVLSFAEKHFEGAQPTLVKKHVEDALGERLENNTLKKSDQRVENEENQYAPDGMQYNPEGITEPNTEKIKDIVAQMPPGSQAADEVLDELLPTETPQDEFDTIGVHYDDLPQFEPVSKPKKEEKEGNGRKENTETSKKELQKDQEKRFMPKREHGEKGKKDRKGTPKESFKSVNKVQTNAAFQKKSLNDRLNRGISFGLNDRLAYIKHLFDDNAADYERVISQLNTCQNFEQAKHFIDSMIKPDHNFWKGKKAYEERFLNAIKNKLV